MPARQPVLFASTGWRVGVRFRFSVLVLGFFTTGWYCRACVLTLSCMVCTATPHAIRIAGNAIQLLDISNAMNALFELKLPFFHLRFLTYLSFSFYSILIRHSHLDCLLTAYKFKNCRQTAKYHSESCSNWSTR